MPKHPLGVCIDCGGVAINAVRNFCATCNDLRFTRKQGAAYWRSRAQGFVHAAVRRGLLPALPCGIACVDCGKPATDYEHRDYGRPLDVEPVCRSCNLKRGPAAQPVIPNLFKDNNPDDAQSAAFNAETND